MLEQDRSCQYSDNQAQIHLLPQPGLVNTSPLLLTKHPGKCVDGIYIVDSETHAQLPPSEPAMHGSEKRKDVAYGDVGSWGVRHKNSV